MITRCTIPCSTVVRPVPRAFTPTSRVGAGRISSLTPKPERPARDDRNDRHGRDGQTDARQRRAKRQVHASLQAVETGSPQRYSSGDRSLAIESRSRISAERLSYSSSLNGPHA
jgi:hypothetical protein